MSPFLGDDCLFGQWRDGGLILDIVCHNWGICGYNTRPLVLQNRGGIEITGLTDLKMIEGLEAF